MSIPRVSSNESRTLFSREIEAARGTSALKLVGEGFMANLFGGLNTQKVNFIFGGLKTWMDNLVWAKAATDVAGLKGSEAIQARKAALKAAARGYAGSAQAEAKYILKTGFATATEDPALHFAGTTLELLREYPDMEIRRTKNGKVLPASFQKVARKVYNYHAYVRRAMVASDIYHRTTAWELLKATQAIKAIAGDTTRPRPKNGKEWEERIDEYNYGKGGVKAALAAAEVKADAALKAGTIGKAQRGVYIQELLDERMAAANGISGAQRLTDLREDAKRWTLASKTEGLLGAMTEISVSMSARIPGFSMLVPAIRVPMNAAYQSLDWTPYGFLRSKVGQWSGGKYSSFSTRMLDRDGTRKFPRPAALITDERIADLRIKSIIGSTMLTAFAAAMGSALGDDDDKAWFFITGRGPTDAQQFRDFKARGLMPYTIRLGGVDINYRETPLYAALVPLGALSDAHRYGKKGEENSERFQAAFAASVQSFGDQAVLKSMQEALAFISGGSTQQGDPVQVFAKRTAQTGAVILAPNLGRDLNTILYGPDNTKEQSWGGNVLANVPFVPGLFRKPAINALGDEIHEHRGGIGGEFAPNMGYRVATRPVKDPQLHFVSRLGINKLSTSKRTKDGADVMDNYDLVRQWAKISGKGIREYLTPAKMSELDALRKTDPVKAEKIFDKAVKDIRTRELDKLLK
jgi:hypothetical protein